MLGHPTKFYQASTSEMFGKVVETPQTEKTPFYPRSPYGCAKLAAHWMSINYRESYGMFNCNGILFNHESQRRGKNFVTRKVVNAFKRIKDGKQDILEMGNLDSERDWGHAKDFVVAMHMMMQHHSPDDYVIATGRKRKVRDFVEVAALYFGYYIRWEGTGLDEVGYDKITGKKLVVINPHYYRPAEVSVLLGDPYKAYDQLGWVQKYDFSDLVDHMCMNEMGD